MTVFLLPMGGDRFELYCEVDQPADVEETPAASGRWWHAPKRWWAKAAAVFRRALAEGEAARNSPRGAEPDATGGRLRRTITRKLAEAVAEQRLLWHLRKTPAAELVHPDEMAGAGALAIAREQLRRDYEKHRLWCFIDALLTIASAPVALLPGPNVLAYYFIFRTVGHYLSLAGARQGLDHIDWRLGASSDLTALRFALALEPADRAPRVEAIAAALGLEHLGAFVERAAEQAG